MLRAGAPALAAADACLIEHIPAQGLYSWHPGSVALSHTRECQGRDTAKLRAVAFPSGLPQCSLRARGLGNHGMGLALPGLCQRIVLGVLRTGPEDGLGPGVELSLDGFVGM